MFTGAGGLDLGIHSAGFVPKVAIECDPIAVATLRDPANVRWWRDCPVIDRPIEAIPSGEILDLADVGPGDTTLLLGGPPCQPFSKSGYWHGGDAKRLNDPRANTLTEYLRVLEDCLPEIFLLENVPGLAFSDKDDGMRYLREAVKAINSRTGTRYRLYASQLNAVGTASRNYGNAYSL